MSRRQRHKKLRPRGSIVDDARRLANASSGLSRQHGAVIPAAEHATNVDLSPPAANNKPDPTAPAAASFEAPTPAAEMPVDCQPMGQLDAPPLQDWPYPLPRRDIDPVHLLPAGWLDSVPDLPDDPGGYDDPGIEACTKKRQQILTWVTGGLASAAEGDDPPGAARPVPLLAADGSGVMTVPVTAADPTLAVILIAAATVDEAGYTLFHLRPESSADIPGIGCSCIHDSCTDAYDRSEITGPYLTSFEAAAVAPSITAAEVPWLSSRAVLDMCLRCFGW